MVITIELPFGKKLNKKSRSYETGTNDSHRDD